MSKPSKTMSIADTLAAVEAADKAVDPVLAIVDQAKKEAEDATVTTTEGVQAMTDATSAKPADAGAFEMFEGIPIPEGRASRESKYQWDALNVGNSFFVPGGKISTFNTLVSTRNKKAAPKKYLAKKFTHNGVMGVMVWRTA